MAIRDKRKAAGITQREARAILASQWRALRELELINNKPIAKAAIESGRLLVIAA